MTSTDTPERHDQYGDNLNPVPLEIPHQEPDDPIDPATASRVVPVMREILRQQAEVLRRQDCHDQRIADLEKVVGATELDGSDPAQSGE